MVRDIIPSQNLTWDDVRDTLAAGGGSVNNDVSSAFKTTANINPWSKHKPVSLNAAFCQDFDESKPNYDADWWVGSKMNCGLQTYSVVNWEDLPDAYNTFSEDIMNGWVYELPQGNASQPFRLGDFAGYAKDALPMYQNFFVPEEVSKYQDSFVCQCMVPPSSNENLTINDFPNIRNCYFGVFLINDNNTHSVRATSEATQGNSVIFSPKEFPTGYYTAYPFLSTVKLEQNGPNIGGAYFTIPYLKPVKFLVGTMTVSIIIKAEKLTSSRTITYEIKVNNPYYNDVTINNNVIVLRNASQEFDDPFEIGVQQKYIEDRTIPYGTTLLATGEFTNVDITVYTNPKIWVSLNSGQYMNSTIPISPIN